MAKGGGTSKLPPPSGGVVAPIETKNDGEPNLDDEEIAIINDLVLELSLVTSLPVASGGRDFIRASAAANSMAYRTESMTRKQLRNFEWTVEPLINLLIVDVDSSIAAKTSFVIRTLMASRICMTRLMKCDGLAKISKVFDIMLSKRVAELRHHSNARTLVEHLGVCYREIARFYPWAIVNIGGLRHNVVMMKVGDVAIQTIATTTMSSLSTDLEICKQMFSYGAIKPLLNVSDSDNTNDACMLAGLGCVTQMCRIPEIAVRVVQQGAVELLEKALHKHSGHNNQAIREKSLFALGFLSKVPSLGGSLCTEVMLDGLKHEFIHGTIGAKTTILQLLMNVHNKYPQERDIITFIRDELLNLLRVAPWNTRNYCLKVFCVLCTDMMDREYMVDHGIIDSILEIIAAKNIELQEAPLVAFLHLGVHPEIPFYLLTKGVAKVAAKLLRAQDVMIKELAVVLLKALSLFNQAEVMRVVPADQHYVLHRDLYNPQKFGSEYGGMILEYLQTIVDNRRAHDYLINLFSDEELEELQVPMENLKIFQNLFMEADAECTGALGVDELKMLMVLKGELMDKEEVADLLKEYDTDLSGNLDFKEFVIMMKGWDTRFGHHGVKKFLKEKWHRGAVGKARRLFNRWWNKDKLIDGEVQLAKDRRMELKSDNRELELKFIPAQTLADRRKKEIQLRQMGISYSPTYFGNSDDPYEYEQPGSSISGSRSHSSKLYLPPLR